MISDGEEIGPCLLHDGPLNNHGYGIVRRNGKVLLAHRVAYSEANNIPLDKLYGVLIRHRCDTPRCKEPRHLLPGTRQDNKDDSVRRGRHKGGTERKLTPDEVRSIRKEYVPGRRGVWNPYGFNGLGRKYGVRASVIQYLINNVTYKEIS